MIEINLLPEEHRTKPMPRKDQRGLPAEQPAPAKMTRATKTTLTVLVAGALAAGAAVWDANANEGWYRRNIALGIGLKEMKRSIQNPQRFPYSFSPWEEYARLEEAILSELQVPKELAVARTESVLEVGNNIANRIATRILKARDTYDIAEAMPTIPRDWLIEAIANEIENEGIFYSEESLLSQAFDPKLHQEGKSTLDCDLIAYLMCHVGRKLDVEMHVVLGPSHVYLTVETGDEEKVFVIEPTKFRKVIQRKVSGGTIIDYGGHGIDEGFFSTFEKQKTHGGIVATLEYEERAGLHRRVTDEQRLKGIILSNILGGLYNDTKSPELKEKICEKAWELTKQSANYTLAKNAYIMCSYVGEKAMESEDTTKAMTAFRRAEWLRKSNELIEEPHELTDIGKLLHRTGKIEEASKVLAEARDFYQRHKKGPVIIGSDGAKYAWNPKHAILLAHSAIVEAERGRIPAGTIYNDLVVPAYNQLGQHKTTRELPEFKDMKDLVDIVRQRNRQR